MKHSALFLLLALVACDSRQRVDQAPLPQPASAPQPTAPQAPVAQEQPKPLPVLGDPYGLLSQPTKPAAPPKAQETRGPEVSPAVKLKPKETIDPGALISGSDVDNLSLPSRPNRRAAAHHRKKTRRK